VGKIKKILGHQKKE